MPSGCSGVSPREFWQKYLYRKGSWRNFHFLVSGYLPISGSSNVKEDRWEMPPSAYLGCLLVPCYPTFSAVGMVGHCFTASHVLAANSVWLWNANLGALDFHFQSVLLCRAGLGPTTHMTEHAGLGGPGDAPPADGAPAARPLLSEGCAQPPPRVVQAGGALRPGRARDYPLRWRWAWRREPEPLPRGSWRRAPPAWRRRCPFKRAPPLSSGAPRGRPAAASALFIAGRGRGAPNTRCAAPRPPPTGTRVAAAGAAPSPALSSRRAVAARGLRGRAGLRASEPWHRSATCSRGDGGPPFWVLNGRRARTPTCVLAAACPRSELRGKEWSAFLPLRGIVYRTQTVLCESSEKPLSPWKDRVTAWHTCVSLASREKERLCWIEPSAWVSCVSLAGERHCRGRERATALFLTSFRSPGVSISALRLFPGTWINICLPFISIQWEILPLVVTKWLSLFQVLLQCGNTTTLPSGFHVACLLSNSCSCRV